MPSPYELNATEEDNIVSNKIYDLQIYPNELPVYSSDEDRSINQSNEDLTRDPTNEEYNIALEELDNAYGDHYDNQSINSADLDRLETISQTDSLDDAFDEDNYSFKDVNNVPIFPPISTAFATRSLSISRFFGQSQPDYQADDEWYSSLLKPFKKFKKMFSSAKKKDEDDEDNSSNFYGSVSSLKFSKALDYFDMLY